MARKRPTKAAHEIRLELIEYTPPGMFLRVAVASGEIGDLKFELCQNVNGDSWVLRIGDRQFVLSAAEFVKSVYEAAFESPVAADAAGGD